MTQFEWLILLLGFLGGAITISFCYCYPMRTLKSQIYKLRGQVYYWSRQMPVAKKRGRPAKKKSV